MWMNFWPKLTKADYANCSLLRTWWCNISRALVLFTFKYTIKTLQWISMMAFAWWMLFIATVIVNHVLLLFVVSSKNSCSTLASSRYYFVNRAVITRVYRVKLIKFNRNGSVILACSWSCEVLCLDTSIYQWRAFQLHIILNVKYLSSVCFLLLYYLSKQINILTIRVCNFTSR